MAASSDEGDSRGETAWRLGLTGRLLELANKGGEGGAYGGDVDRAGSRRGDVA